MVNIYNNTTTTQYLKSILGEMIRKWSEDRRWEHV